MPVTLVTGSSSGFGFRTARLFARRGHTVAATMRDPAKGDELRRLADDEGLDLHVPTLDVTDPEGVIAAVDGVVADLGGLDVVVSNAGLGLEGPVEEVSDAEARRVFDVNVFGTLNVARAAVPHLRAQGSGAFVALSSVAGIIAAPFDGIYSASKWAVEAACESLHFELQAAGVRVALIEPGGFPTGFDANRVRAEAFGEESPYHGIATRFREARRSVMPGRTDDPEAAEIVAEAIWEAVTTDEPKLRWPVGDEAELLSALRASTDFDGFEQAVRQTLDFWE
ncbi:MAG: SDR family oxidoreductase [Actinomycetota bacterium]|nr:SDR family oxidoreductase [Actinomycetota bacterium]